MIGGPVRSSSSPHGDGRRGHLLPVVRLSVRYRPEPCGPLSSVRFVRWSSERSRPGPRPDRRASLEDLPPRGPTQSGPNLRQNPNRVRRSIESRGPLTNFGRTPDGFRRTGEARPSVRQTAENFRGERTDADNAQTTLSQTTLSLQDCQRDNLGARAWSATITMKSVAVRPLDQWARWSSGLTIWLPVRGPGSESGRD